MIKNNFKILKKQYAYLQTILKAPVKFCLFVLRFYGPVNPMGVMSSAVSLPNHTFTGQA